MDNYKDFVISLMFRFCLMASHLHKTKLLVVLIDIQWPHLLSYLLLCLSTNLCGVMIYVPFFYCVEIIRI